MDPPGALTLEVPLVVESILSALIHIVMVLASLVWLWVLVKIPWDLYFAARRGRIDAEESKARGIAVADKDYHDLRTMERRLLWAALGAHLVTAAGVWFIASLSGGIVRPEFAFLYLFSATFRPAWEVHAYLRRRLAELAGRVRHPRDDVLALLARVEDLFAQIKTTTAEVKAEVTRIDARLNAQDAALRQVQHRQGDDAARLSQRISGLAARFEEAVAQMSADKELLAGVRAFARMFRQEATPS